MGASAFSRRQWWRLAWAHCLHTAHTYTHCGAARDLRDLLTWQDDYLAPIDVHGNRYMNGIRVVTDPTMGWRSDPPTPTPGVAAAHALQGRRAGDCSGGGGGGSQAKRARTGTDGGSFAEPDPSCLT